LPGTEIKRPPKKLCARTARDYSTTFGAGCKAAIASCLLILLSHEATEWKKIRQNAAEERLKIKADLD
jgi:hypothetical protein